MKQKNLSDDCTRRERGVDRISSIYVNSLSLLELDFFFILEKAESNLYINTHRHRHRESYVYTINHELTALNIIKMKIFC